MNTDGKEKKTNQIPTSILLHWKRYMMSAVLLFGILGLIIGFFIYENASQYYSTIYKEKLTRANHIKNAKQSFQSIDQSMERINTFMEKRGLAPFELENKGGPNDFDVTETNEIAEFYANDILKMEDLIRNTRIGKTP